MSTPGWYPNPDGSDSKRFWDGQQWGQVATPTAPQVTQPPAASPPAKKLHGWKKAAVIAAAVIAGLYALNFVIEAGQKPEPTAEEVAAEKAADAKQEAQNAARTAAANAELLCEEAVTNQLKSPSTADFPDKHTVMPFQATGHEVRGVVDSQNGFGATVRSYFGCTVVPASVGRYTVEVTELFTP